MHRRSNHLDHSELEQAIYLSERKAHAALERQAHIYYSRCTFRKRGVELRLQAMITMSDEELQGRVEPPHGEVQLELPCVLPGGMGAEDEQHPHLMHRYDGVCDTSAFASVHANAMDAEELLRLRAACYSSDPTVRVDPTELVAEEFLRLRAACSSSDPTVRVGPTELVAEEFLRLRAACSSSDPTARMAAQRYREQSACQLLLAVKNGDSSIQTLNLYVKKTKAVTTEDVRKEQGGFLHEWTYKTPLRDLHAEGYAASKKAAKTACAASLLGMLRAATVTNRV